jgi:hypothetical protein
MCSREDDPSQHDLASEALTQTEVRGPTSTETLAEHEQNLLALGRYMVHHDATNWDGLELGKLIAGAINGIPIVRASKEDRTVFDLRWQADMRAIKLWQAAHPGNDLVWPDHADLVVWLLEQRDAR